MWRSERRRPRTGALEIAALGALAMLAFLALVRPAGSAVLHFDTPISGDVVPVTVELRDGTEGVEVALSIPAGEGDLLGLFGNVGDESLLSSLGIADPTAIVTQWQIRANRVWKVGGGNTLAPVRTWDWGVKLGATGSPGGAVVESAAFTLTGPGLTVDELLGAQTEGWVLGVRIQGTAGPEGSSKLGLSEDAPRIRIESPAAGALVGETPTPVDGRVLGAGVAVDVDGVPAAVAQGTFAADVPLVEGPTTLVATGTNAFGTATDAVDVVLDTTPPVVAIEAPADGTLTAEAEVLVSGTVSDASPIATFTLNGQPVPLEDGAFAAALELDFGESSIVAEATDAAGNTGSDAVAVVRGEPPTVAIVTPAGGSLLAPGPVEVRGTATGLPAPEVAVNGTAATVATDGTWVASVSVGEGPATLTATATNPLGTDTAAVAVSAGLPPTVAITAPAEGLLTNETPLAVEGTVTGTAPVAVEVNGVAASVAGDAFTASVPVTEGANALVATASSSFGSASAEVSITLDTTPPVVTITSPTDGAELAEQPIGVFGSVADASPIVDLRIDGDPIAPDTAFATTAALAEGPNTITVAATDAAGNTGSGSVTVTLTASEPLDVAIALPPEDSLVSRERIEVSGTVSDPAARVTVNGVVAAVAGGQWVAAAVPLEEGPNDLVATARRGTEAASDAIQVVFNAPPRVVITSPVDGAFVNAAQTDVEGVVDDPTAFVDLNGVEAAVDSGGRWRVREVPLQAGENALRARAVDPLGAVGRDRVEVVRDDAAAPPLRLVLAHLTPFASEDTSAGTVGFSNDAEWRAALARRGSPATAFEPPLDQAVVGGFVTAYVLSETSEVPALEALFLGDLPLQNEECRQYPDSPNCEPIPIEFDVRLGTSGPIEAIQDTNPFLNDFENPEVLSPPDFVPRFFFAFEVRQLPFGEAGPIGTGPVQMVATQGEAVDTIGVLWDEEPPEALVLSPPVGSVLAGDTVTATVRVEEIGSSLYGQLDYTLTMREGFVDIVVDEGSAPIVEGRATLADLPVGMGSHRIRLTARDSAGRRDFASRSFTIDPDAPAVSLVSPRDGEALTVDAAPVDLNFATATTLVRVNGVADGRTLGPGLVRDALTLPLVPGENTFALALEGPGGETFDLAFTLFRVQALTPVRITRPADGSVTNQETLEVRGVAPVGTPFVEVNGIAASLGSDGSFAAEVPIAPGRNTLRAEGVFGDPAVVEVTGDFEAPELLLALPEDGAFTPEALLGLSGLAGKPARLELAGPGGQVAGQTRSNPFVGLGLGLERAAFAFDLPLLELVDGPNALMLTLTDAAGNATTEPLTVTRADGAVQLVSPADGAALDAPRADLAFGVLEDVTVDALYAAGRRLPGFEGVTLLAPGSGLANVPLAPGPSAYRLVYTRPEGAQEVLSFTLESTAETFATVSGTVTDATTGEAVDGALVELTDVATGTTFVVVTGPDGGYEAPVEPGTLEVAVASEGFAPAQVSLAPAAGDELARDVALDPTGVPAGMNEVAVLVPPDGTVTDFERLTVVGTVLNPASEVTVNGISADVVGNRFTARGVPLTLGANTLEVSATALGVPAVTESVSVERAAEPVLDVAIYSPPAGATIPGGGLVVRAFTSARDSLVTVDGAGMAVAEEGVARLDDVTLPLDATRLEARAERPTTGASAEAQIPVAVDSTLPALRLRAEPSHGPAPLATTLTVTNLLPLPGFDRRDFDLDGDDVLEVVGSAEAAASAVLDSPHPRVARAFATGADGVELTAGTVVSVHLPAEVRREFAQGSPVDLAPAPGGDLYVLDAAASTLSRYTRDGALVASFGASGTGNGQLLDPRGLAVGSGGRLYVADTGNDRIQVFEPDGTFLETLVSGGPALGQVASPRALLVDDASLFVSEEGNARVQQLDRAGRPVSAVPLASPRGLAQGPGSGLLMASPTEGLQLLGRESRSSPPTLALLQADQRLEAPVDVAEGDDVLLVADAAPAAVRVFSRDLHFLQSVPLERAPRAVLGGTRPEEETLYVADGSRVLEIALPVPSPLPALQALKDRLAAGDVERALQRVHPLQRSVFRRIYAQLGQQRLARDAQLMQLFSVQRLRGGSAVALIHMTEAVGDQPVERTFPVHLVRSKDGTWQIFDY